MHPSVLLLYLVVPVVVFESHWYFQQSYAPFFETVIRYLGGLLSAYALSGEPILLSRADDLGTMLLPAFDTTHGLPMYAVNTVSYVFTQARPRAI